MAQSDWARLACLRSDWSADADLLAIAHDGTVPQIDLSAAGVPIIAGDWQVDLLADGKPVELTDEWESTCWFSDRDVDFLELQRKSKTGIVIDRQILLSRNSNYACLTDCIHGGGAATLEYAARLQPVPDAELERDSNTRELRICRNNRTARCYPLALPCDRVAGTAGEFSVAPGSMQLKQIAVGGLVAPLVLDWSRGRRKRPAEWRRLTVGEEGTHLGSDNASGFRLRVGRLHLVVYRSLLPTRVGRTVLGLHTRHETVVGNFTSDGEVEPILLVE